MSHEHNHGNEVDALIQTKGEKRIYLLENLGCAHCASLMEQKIQELPGVEASSIVFPTKQLRLVAEDHNQLLPKIQKICSSIEDNVVVTLLESNSYTKSSPKEDEKEGAKDLWSIIIGIVLFLLGFLFEDSIPLFSTLLFILAYLVLGLEVLWTAAKNIVKGNIFDENFLMSIATLGAFAISQYEEAVGVMLFYRIGEWFEDRAVSRSRKQILEALDLRPETVNLLNGNDIQVIDAKEAVVGDILLVRPGDRIPLDGTITEGESRLDTSPVTGEPVPVKVTPGSQILSGCLNTSGVLNMRVDKVLAESMVSRILDSVENAAASKPKIDRFLTKFSRVYTPLVVFLALCTALLPSLFTGNWSHWIYTALTFLVISCPCALVLSVPLAFFSGIGAGSKQKILFKGGASLEALKHIKSVIMDKTGTLTKGNFVLQLAAPSTAYIQDFSSAEEASDALLSLAAACEVASTHPIAESIVEAAINKGLTLPSVSSIEEISGHGIHAVISGGTVLCGNRRLLENAGVNLSEYQNEDYGTEVLLSLNQVYIGYLSIADTLKEDALDAVTSLHRQGILTAMLTGDSKESAEFVASKLGIKEVHAKLLPEDKLTVLQTIRQEHGAVMYVGDGINDAPVLAGADVGAAMGNGADAAMEAADVVFMTSNASAIPEAIRIAKVTSRVAIQNVVFALTIKILVMILGLAGFASMWLAVFADTGVAFLCILNSIRILYYKPGK